MRRGRWHVLREVNWTLPLRRSLLACCLLVGGTAWSVPPPGAAPARPASAEPRRSTALREQVLERARSLVGLTSLRRVTGRVPDDCAGLVRLVFEEAGVDVMREGRSGDNGVRAIHRRAKRTRSLHRRRPRPGDLVFFRETYDRNRDGRRNDGLTHVGVVESVERDGTITFIHRGGKGVHRSKLNLRRPRQRTAASGIVLNDFIRRKGSRTRGYLAGELFVGYADADRFARGERLKLSRRP